MAAFPSRSDAERFQSIVDCRTWVGLAAEPWKALEEGTGNLANALRNLALLPHPVVFAAIRAARLGEGSAQRILTPIEAAQVGLVWRIARRLAFVASGARWDDFLDVDPTLDPAKPELQTFQRPPAAQAAPAPSATPSDGFKKVKISTCLDQADETEVPLAATTDSELWYQRYVTQRKAAPPAEEDVTAEQLTALHHRVFVAKGTPYADFSVWGPYARRTMRAARFRTWIPQADGTYLGKELPGPENHDAWLVSWRCLYTAYLMLEIASDAALDAYAKNIKKLVKTWPAAWHLIVQADDEMRATYFERIRRRLAADTVRTGSCRQPDWSASAPWTAVLFEAALDNDFWDEHVRHPAAAWMAAGGRGTPLAAEERMARDHMAGISGTTRSHAAIETHSEPIMTKAKKRRLRQAAAAAGNAWVAAPPPPGKAAGKGAGKDQQGKGKGKGKGKNKTDQQGKQICYSWNNRSGACAAAADGAECAHGRAHKCQVCLSPSHRAVDCPQFH